MVSAKGSLRTEGFPYALDNGAWTAHVKGLPFDSGAFLKALDLLGAEADFIVIPDIVAGGERSLEFSLTWINRVRPYGRMMLLPVQDEMTVDMVEPHIAPDMGLFIGGTTEFKERTIPLWGAFSCYVHCGRVNSRRRLKLCKHAGVDSFDGSGPSRFVKHARRMDAELRQWILQ